MNMLNLNSSSHHFHEIWSS